MSKVKVMDSQIDSFKTGKMPYLKIKCHTWFRDSYGLFDYDSDRITTSEAAFYDSYHLNRTGDNLE